MQHHPKCTKHTLRHYVPKGTRSNKNTMRKPTIGASVFSARDRRSGNSRDDGDGHVSNGDDGVTAAMGTTIPCPREAPPPLQADTARLDTSRENPSQNGDNPMPSSLGAIPICSIQRVGQAILRVGGIRRYQLSITPYKI